MIRDILRQNRSTLHSPVIEGTPPKQLDCPSWQKLMRQKLSHGGSRGRQLGSVFVDNSWRKPGREPWEQPTPASGTRSSNVSRRVKAAHPCTAPHHRKGSSPHSSRAGREKSSPGHRRFTCKPLKKRRKNCAPSLQINSRKSLTSSQDHQKRFGAAAGANLISGLRSLTTGHWPLTTVFLLATSLLPGIYK